MKVDFKYDIGHIVIAENRATGKRVNAEIVAVCFDGDTNLYHLTAADYKSGWVREDSLRKR